MIDLLTEPVPTSMTALATPSAATVLTSTPVVQQPTYRICLLSDDLSGTPDEGVKKFTMSIAEALRGQHDVHVLSTSHSSAIPGVRCVSTSRTFLGRSLRREIRQLQPEVLVYATRRSATFFSIIRSRILRLYAPSATLILFGLQTRQHSRWQQWIIRGIRPDLICVQSDANGAYLRRLGCQVALVPSGVDTRVFHPIDAIRKRELREQYGLDPHRPVALHVGHLQHGRGIRTLADLAATGACQVVLVTSSSTFQDAALERELRAADVIILTDYLPQIEQLYQLADCYVFPVASTDNAIEAPLSVLEALACDLPVVTTRFGGLPRMFADVASTGLVFVDSSSELIEETVRQCTGAPGSTRDLVQSYSWEGIAADLLDRAVSSGGVSRSHHAASANVVESGNSPGGGTRSHR